MIGPATDQCYASTIGKNAANYRSRQRGRAEDRDLFYVYDNYANEPFRTGARRGTESLTVLNSALWFFPHRYRGRNIVGIAGGNATARRGATTVAAAASAGTATTRRARSSRLVTQAPQRRSVACAKLREDPFVEHHRDERDQRQVERNAELDCRGRAAG